jgi:hypothetical protein
MKHRPFAAPSSRPAPIAYNPVATEDPEYPAIDEFLDELPPIEDFLAVDVAEVPVASGASEDEWLAAGWNSFDVGSLSELAQRTPALGQRAVAEFAKGASTDLSAPGPSAEEIAAALDGIAMRIRSGELVIDNLQSTPPEVAMAAAIAALLRMRG